MKNTVQYKLEGDEKPVGNASARGGTRVRTHRRRTTRKHNASYPIPFIGVASA